MKFCFKLFNAVVVMSYHRSCYSRFIVIGVENGEKPQEKLEFSQDVVDALELLLQYTPLLDIMDAKCSCNCIECLLKELLRNGLVTESHVTHFTSKRCVLPLASRITLFHDFK